MSEPPGRPGGQHQKEEERARELGSFSLKKRQGYCCCLQTPLRVIETVQPDSFQRDRVVREEVMDVGTRGF